MDAAARVELSKLLARVADGDRAAFHPVFVAVLPVARAFARRALAGGVAGASAADADDVAQDALMKVFARAHEYDRARDAMPWILGIVAWECRSAKKRA